MTRTVVQYIDTDVFGGAERALLILLGGLDRRRWRPVVFHHPEPGLAPLLAGARELAVETRALARMHGPSRVAHVLRFIRALRAEHPAVFHAHLSWPLGCRSALLAASIARTPAVIATQHLFMPISSRRSIWLQRLIASHVDRYIAVSAEVARGLRHNFGFPERKVEVVPNAIPLDGFDRDADRAALVRLRATLTGGRDERPIVLTVARLHEQKGHDTLLDAAALASDAMFVLAGDGPLRDHLQHRARQLGIADRVLFLGQRDDVPELLAAADLFVLPSLYEGLPLSVLEAMAAGTPAIATAIGGTDEAVIDGCTGLLVPPRDATALANAIRRLIADRALAERLATAARARVRREFAVDTMICGITGIYDTLLGQRVS